MRIVRTYIHTYRYRPTYTLPPSKHKCIITSTLPCNGMSCAVYVHEQLVANTYIGISCMCIHIIHALPHPKHNHKYFCMHASHISSLSYVKWGFSGCFMNGKGFFYTKKTGWNLADTSTRIDIFALQKTIEFSLKRLARFYSWFLSGAKEPFTVLSQVLMPISLPSPLSHACKSCSPPPPLQGQGQRTSCVWMLTNLKTLSTRPANTSGRWRRSRRHRQWRRSTLQTSTSTYSQKWRPTWRWVGQWVGECWEDGSTVSKKHIHTYLHFITYIRYVHLTCGRVSGWVGVHAGRGKLRGWLNC